jgi:hypothetical protein
VPSRWRRGYSASLGPPRTAREDAPGRIRTCDFVLRRDALYPLSYGRLGRQLSLPYKLKEANIRSVRTGPYLRIMGRDVETVTRGNAAEAAVLNALIGLGLPVLVPFGGGTPYDLVVQLPTRRFLRVQCKAGRLYRGCVMFNARTTDHGRGRLTYQGLADIFGVYFAPRQAVYLLPVDELSCYVARLRLDATRNNQRRGVRFAADYEISNWTIDALCELAARIP